MASLVDEIKKQVKNLERLVLSLQHQLWTLETEVKNIRR